MRENIDEFTIILKGKLGVLYYDHKKLEMMPKAHIVTMTENEAKKKRNKNMKAFIT